jgi:hypothetical protein
LKKKIDIKTKVKTEKKIEELQKEIDQLRTFLRGEKLRQTCEINTKFCGKAIVILETIPMV